MDKTITRPSYTLFYQITDNTAKAPAAQAGSVNRRVPVILLHGFAEDSRIWEDQIPYLQEQFQLIIPDLPGSGRSSLTGETSMEAQADAVKAILDEENIESCILIGHSMGGYIILAFAEKYPDKVRAFGLFHSTAFADSEEKKETRRKGIEFIRNNGSAPFIKQSTPNSFSETSRKEHPEWVTALIDQYADFKPDSLIRYYDAMIARQDRTHVLRSFPRPILFIIGAQDNIIPLAPSLQQCYLPKCSHVHILERSGHTGMKEEAQRSNQILQDFINYNYEQA